MKKKEMARMKAYFLELAKKYEKNGYDLAAADIYKRYKPDKAKKIYLNIARNAEKKKLYAMAAEAYKSAGKIKKSRVLWKIIANDDIKKGMPTLAKEALKNSKPENPKYKNVRKIVSIAAKFEREGKFKQSQKQWIKSAKYWEKMGEFRFAARHYYNGGDISNAKRVWKKIGPVA